MIGKVVSNKTQKTVIVEVERLVADPIYKKRIRKTSSFQVDDVIGVKEGDMVRIESTRPISKNKSHKVVEIIEKSTETKKKPSERKKK